MARKFRIIGGKPVYVERTGGIQTVSVAGKVISKKPSGDLNYEPAVLGYKKVRETERQQQQIKLAQARGEQVYGSASLTISGGTPPPTIGYSYGYTAESKNPLSRFYNRISGEGNYLSRQVSYTTGTSLDPTRTTTTNVSQQLEGPTFYEKYYGEPAGKVTGTISGGIEKTGTKTFDVTLNPRRVITPVLLEPSQTISSKSMRIYKNIPTKGVVGTTVDVAGWTVPGVREYKATTFTTSLGIESYEAGKKSRGTFGELGSFYLKKSPDILTTGLIAYKPVKYGENYIKDVLTVKGTPVPKENVVAPEVLRYYETGGKEGTAFPMDKPSTHLEWFKKKNIQRYGLPQENLPEGLRGKSFGYSATGISWGKETKIGEAGQYYSGKGVSVGFLRMDNVPGGETIGKSANKPIVYAGYFSEAKVNPAIKEMKIPNPYEPGGKPIKQYLFSQPTREGVLNIPVYKREVEGVVFGERIPVKQEFYFKYRGRRVPIEEQTFVTGLTEKELKSLESKGMKRIVEPQYSILPSRPSSPKSYGVSYYMPSYISSPTSLSRNSSLSRLSSLVYKSSSPSSKLSNLYRSSTISSSLTSSSRKSNIYKSSSSIFTGGSSFTGGGSYSPPKPPVYPFFYLPKREKSQKKSKSIFGSTRFKEIYTPDVTSLSFNIRGMKPSKRSYRTGGLRPII